MKKAMIKILAQIIIPIMMLTSCAFATEAFPIEEMIEGDGIENLLETVPKTAQDIMGDEGIQAIVENTKPESLMATIATLVKEYLTAPLRIFISLCGMMVLSAMLEVFHTTLNSSGGRDIFQIMISAVVATVTISPIVECIYECANTLVNYSYFTATFIPVLSGLMTASGQPLTGSAFNILLFWICQMTSNIISQFFVPLLCAYLSLAMISIICPDLHIQSIVGGIKAFILWGLSLTLTIFLGMLSIQSVVASSGDNLSIRTAKFMIGSQIPGVGGALADLFVAAQGWMHIAKGSVGAFGVIVTLFTFLPILIKVALWYISLNCASIVGNMLGTKQAAALMKNISSTLGIMLAVLMYQSMLVIISTTMMIMAFKT